MSKNPIQTFKSSKTIVKVCVEDSHKIYDFIEDTLRNIYTKGYLLLSDKPIDDNLCIVGKGVAKLSEGDIFNEEIGNEIAFRKAKLNANIKKFNLYNKIISVIIKYVKGLEEQRDKILNYINKDTEAIRVYNPKFKVNI